MFNLFKKRSILENPSIPLANYTTGKQFVNYNQDCVLQNPFIRRGISLIGSLAGTLPLNVYVDGGLTGRAVDANHPRQFKLNVRPTPSALKVAN